MRVLVTGANGFVGRRLVGTLARAGDDVFAVVRRQDCEFPATVIVADEALDAGFLHGVMKAHRVDAVVNTLAAGVDPSDRSVSGLIAANAVFPGALADAAGRAGVGAFVQIGSSAEYAPKARGQSLEEGDPLDRERLYGATKAAGSLIAQSAARLAGMSAAVLRLFNVFGPGEKPHRLFPSLVRRLSAGERVPLSAGTQMRDFLHIDDACSAIRRMLEALAGRDKPLVGEYNLASGEATSVRDFALDVAASCRADAGLLDFGSLPMRPDDLPHVVAATGKLDGLIGRAKRLTLAQAIEEACGEMRSGLFR